VYKPSIFSQIFKSRGTKSPESEVRSKPPNTIVRENLDSCSYAERVANELQNHSGIFHKNESSEEIRRFSWRVGAFDRAMQIYSPYLQSLMPDIAINPRVLERIRNMDCPARILTLGCATGDWELTIAREFPDKTEVTLVDLNSELLQEGASYGEKYGLKVNTHSADVNTYEIKPGYYDFIVCRSSLHHFIMLEEVLQKIHGGLAEGGEFLVIGEWIGRNGLQIYPETEALANKMFAELPERLRRSAYTGQVDKRLPNIDHSVNSFEAVRSEEILPAVLKIFKPVEYAAYDTLVTLFFDFRYGSNYKLDDESDHAIVERITLLDIDLLQKKTLRPTAMCGIFSR
jgi:ubiquinone/menaquinone biosynthesis C-methylase UbiE